jgi:hypothetical protein
MTTSKLFNIESPFVETLLRNLDSTVETKTSITPAKHTFFMFLNSPIFHEKYTPIHTKFEEVLIKYHQLYPEEFESYMKQYNEIKGNLKPK